MGGMIHIADWYATFAGLAGVDPTDTLAASSGLPPIDSIDVWPFLAGKVPLLLGKSSPLPVIVSCRVIGNSSQERQVQTSGKGQHFRTAALVAVVLPHGHTPIQLHVR